MPRPVHPVEAWADAYALTREARRANAATYTVCQRALRAALPNLFATDDLLARLEALERAQMAAAEGIPFIPSPGQLEVFAVAA